MLQNCTKRGIKIWESKVFESARQVLSLPVLALFDLCSALLCCVYLRTVRTRLLYVVFSSLSSALSTVPVSLAAFLLATALTSLVNVLIRIGHLRIRRSHVRTSYFVTVIAATDANPVGETRPPFLRFARCQSFLWDKCSTEIKDKARKWITDIQLLSKANRGHSTNVR